MRTGTSLFLLNLACWFLTDPIRVIAQETRQDTLKEIQRQVEILTEELERLQLGEVTETSSERQYGLGPAAAKVYQLKKSGVSLAGYGEVLYQNFSELREDGNPSDKADQADFLRNVLYVGFRFNDWILFNSELEFEHANTDEGEVSVEFGYIDLLLKKEFNVRAGMVLVPLGIINTRHEPSTYSGSRRPEVELAIIPTTWRANGAGIFGEIASGVNYHLYILEGLNAADFNATGIRAGRQGGSKALAENISVAGRLEYTSLSGATLGGSFFKGNSGQGIRDAEGTISAATTLYSVHGEYGWKRLELRGLYAHVSIEDASRLNRLKGMTGTESIGKTLGGWYVTAAYDVIPLLRKTSTHYLAPFVQYQRYNTQATVPSGYAADPANDRAILSAGLAYKPHPNVAFKFDYEEIRAEANTGIDQWNLALNYLF